MFVDITFLSSSFCICIEHPCMLSHIKFSLQGFEGPSLVSLSLKLLTNPNPITQPHDTTTRHQLLTSSFKKVNCVALMSLAIHVRGLRVQGSKKRENRGDLKRFATRNTFCFKTGKMLSIYVMLVPLWFHLMGSKWFYFHLLYFCCSLKSF